MATNMSLGAAAAPVEILTSFCDIQDPEGVPAPGRSMVGVKPEILRLPFLEAALVASEREAFAPVDQSNLNRPSLLWIENLPSAADGVVR